MNWELCWKHVVLTSCIAVRTLYVMHARRTLCVCVRQLCAWSGFPCVLNIPVSSEGFPSQVFSHVWQHIQPTPIICSFENRINEPSAL